MTHVHKHVQVTFRVQIFHRQALPLPLPQIHNIPFLYVHINILVVCIADLHSTATESTEVSISYTSFFVPHTVPFLLILSLLHKHRDVGKVTHSAECHLQLAVSESRFLKIDSYPLQRRWMCCSDSTGLMKFSGRLYRRHDEVVH